MANSCVFRAAIEFLIPAIPFSELSQCVNYAYIVRPIVHCLPAWFRFAQCLRRYYDSREAFPHLANALKYSTTFFVVMFLTLREKYKG